MSSGSHLSSPEYTITTTRDNAAHQPQVTGEGARPLLIYTAAAESLDQLKPHTATINSTNTNVVVVAVHL